MEKTFVVGVNFKNSDINIRSKFSIPIEKQIKCYELAKKYNFKNFIVLNTCNRTEIYGEGQISLAEDIITNICNQSNELFNEYKFIKTSNQAINHMFNVASGLDSQILGDYEILGQFKNACKMSKNNGLLDPIFERMVNICIESSKEIKTKTELSKGTISASYATIEILKEKFGGNEINCLLIGMGNFGNSISKNIKHYLPNIKLSISNRTDKTSMEIGELNKFNVIPFKNIKSELKNFDVVILTMNSDDYIVTPQTLFDSKIKLILDLSIPQTVHPDSKFIKNIEFLDINTISNTLDKSIENRKIYLPIAHEIINNHINSFIDWVKFNKNKDQIIFLKNMLIESTKKCPYLSNIDKNIVDNLINKTVRSFVVKLKSNENLKFETETIVNDFTYSLYNLN